MKNLGVFTYPIEILITFEKILSKPSVADPERFDADPDPTFQADADPDPNPFTRVKIFFLPIFNYCFQSLPNLVICNFSARMQEEG